MSLSLEVLPRVVDPGKDLATIHITRVALYDQFVEHWLERGKKRLGEKELSPQSRSAFESLVDEGFTRNGIDYLKKLNEAGTTLIYTSHQLNEAEDLCDSIALIDEGRIIVHDSLDSLLAAHGHEGLEGLFLELTGKNYRDQSV